MALELKTGILNSDRTSNCAITSRKKYWVIKMQHSAVRYRNSMRTRASIFPWPGIAGAENAIYKKRYHISVTERENLP